MPGQSAVQQPPNNAMQLMDDHYHRIWILDSHFNQVHFATGSCFETKVSTAYACTVRNASHGNQITLGSHIMTNMINIGLFRILNFAKKLCVMLSIYFKDNSYCMSYHLVQYTCIKNSCTVVF